MKKHVYIIAEAGVNHNGSLDLAMRLIDTAADAGADAVKFQTFKAEAVASSSAPKAAYQKLQGRNSGTQLDMLRKLELDEAAHQVLAAHCRTRKIQFLSTPFDSESIDLLVHRLKVPMLKLSSGEITNAPLLLDAALTRKPIVLSTGMSTIEEIREALGVLAFGYLRLRDAPSVEAFREAFRSEAGQCALKEKVALLHCTSEYPAPFKDINLLAMNTMRSTFNLRVGLSDHTPGIAVAIAAAALGASIIEKHFTLDRNLPGPDHQASLEPDELHSLVRSVREVEVALGSAEKKPTGSELKNIRIVRRSLVALKDIESGEMFSLENLGCKRPGTGMSPFNYWQTLGKISSKRYCMDDKVKA